jgi:hypothetical protein
MQFSRKFFSKGLGWLLGCSKRKSLHPFITSTDIKTIILIGHLWVDNTAINKASFSPLLYFQWDWIFVKKQVIQVNPIFKTNVFKFITVHLLFCCWSKKVLGMHYQYAPTIKLCSDIIFVWQYFFEAKWWQSLKQIWLFLYWRLKCLPKQPINLWSI